MRINNSNLLVLLIGLIYSGGALANAVFVSGTVTDYLHRNLPGIDVELFDVQGTKSGTANTNENGQWSIAVNAPGIYYARTVTRSSDKVIHEVWNNIPCDDCDPVSNGTQIKVADDNIYGISFQLEASVTQPLFSSSFESVPWEPRLSRIKLAGRDLFFNGINLAWRSFADDIGPDPVTPELSHFESVFQQLRSAGGNVMRLWLHTDGTATPEWNGMTVSGPGANTISDLQAILDLADQYDVRMMLCLWSFDMLRKTNAINVIDRNRAILTQPFSRQSYIDNALTPMVKALKGHPAIFAWEIFNEPEGMSSELGWPINYKVSMLEIQAFINQTAAAIHRADPGANVTNGAIGFQSNTDIGEDNYNYYSDKRLIDAGGDADGVLDFYAVHFYSWAGKAGSPFYNTASNWQLDKPIVIAEFFSDCDFCGPDPHQTLYDNGYAGALNWSWTDKDSETLLAPVVSLATRHPEDIIINPEGRPTVTLNFPQNDAVLTFGESVTLQADSSDTDGNIEYVEFYQGGQKIGLDDTAPYELDITIETLDEMSFYAQAKDNEGNLTRTPRHTVSVEFASEPDHLEAEFAEYSSLFYGLDPLASGGAYLEMQGTGSLRWTIPNVTAAGEYYLIIGHNLYYDSPKTQWMSINDGSSIEVIFEGELGVWQQRLIKVDLVAGNNTIEITPSWGWMFFDYIALITQ